MIESLIFQLMAIIFGAIIGSFLNVVIYRIPAGLSVLYPPSRCPKCLKKLNPQDNIPIIGWFLIKGKCRNCHQKVAWRYPAIEATTAFVFWLVVASFMGQPLMLVIGSCLFLSYLIALAMIDIDTMTLPNALTQSGLILGISFHIFIAATMFSSQINNHSQNLHFGILSIQSPVAQIINSVLGAVVGIWLVDFVRILGQWLLQKEAMGGGDAKLAAMIGAWLGWQELLLTILIAAILGSLVGAFIIRLQNFGQNKPYPFGPFLAVGAMFSMFYGEQIIFNYLKIFGLSAN